MDRWSAWFALLGPVAIQIPIEKGLSVDLSYFCQRPGFFSLPLEVMGASTHCLRLCEAGTIDEA